MIVLKIYDKELNFLGFIDDFVSLIWTRRYYEPGNFELHIPLSTNNISLVGLGHIVSKSYDNEQPHECGVMEVVDIVETQSERKIVLKGRFMSSYFDRRLIQQTLNFNGPSEQAMGNCINHCTSIPLVQVKAIKGYPEQINFQATMKNLLAILVKIAKTSNIGFKLIPNFKTKILLFETYKGIDKSLEQTEYNPVIFSENYDNLSNPSYSITDIDLKTKVIVGGEGEGVSRKYITIGIGSGLELRELFVDAKDISSEGLNASQYEDALKQRGLEALATATTAESFEFETESVMNFKYKVNYDLGDIITVNKISWGIKVSKRITEIQEIYENGGVKIIPTLGNPLAEVVDWSDE